ncbi:hypothetical protein SAMN05428988_3186 [Chitinophaga sp. YR573]|nr:hypothetical protein SAMN05428988_3186 [Chitinophaga sp. YR573]
MKPYANNDDPFKCPNTQFFGESVHYRMPEVPIKLRELKQKYDEHVTTDPHTCLDKFAGEMVSSLHINVNVQDVNYDLENKLWCND